ncbi:MAG: O-antigen ligase family protein [bacterium]|nr:O-antigen ligase family protein [bacterium]
MESDVEEVNRKLEHLIVLFLFLYCCFSSISISAAETALGIALILWIVTLIKKRFKNLSRSSIDLPIITFIIFRLISTFAGVDPANSLLKLKEVGLFIVVYLIQFNMNKNAFVKLMKTMVYAGGISVVSRIIYMYLIKGLKFGLANRLSGFSSGYMTFGSILTIIILFGISVLFFSENTNKEKAFLGVSIFVLVIGLGLTLTRSAWIGLVAGLFFIGVFKERVFLMILIGLVITGFLFSPPKIKDRFISIFSSKDATVQTRFQMWSWGWEVFKDRPVFGIGPNNVKKYKDVWDKYKIEGEAKNQMVHQHSNFMQMLVTLGISGFLSYIWLLISMLFIFIKGVKNLGSDKHLSGVTWGALTGFVGFIVTGVFEFNFFDSEVTLLIFFLLGSILAINRGYEEHKAVINED